jgi:hypothetical protein
MEMEIAGGCRLSEDRMAPHPNAAVLAEGIGGQCDALEEVQMRFL